MKLSSVFGAWVCSAFMYSAAQADDLIDIYHLALDNDPDLKFVYYNQYATAELKSQSIAQMLPQINLTASSSLNRLVNNKSFTFQGGGPQNYWNNLFSINLRQPIFNWGHWVQLGQADNRIAAAEAQYQAKFQELMVVTTEAYFNVLSAQDNLFFTVAEKKAIEKQLEQAKQRFEVGLIAITGVYEAQAAYDQSVANEYEAENQLHSQEEALYELIGPYQGKLNLLKKPLELVMPDPSDIDVWDKGAEQNNFSIVAQINQTEVARKQINLNRSEHLPVIDIVAGYSQQDNTSSFGLRGNTETVGLELNIPLFSGGGTYSRTQQAEYEFLKEKENLTKIKRSVSRQVRDAYHSVESNLSRVKALRATVKSSTSALEATEAGFSVGTRTMVDVLAEQRNLYRTKADFSRSRYDYLISGIRLKQAAGSLSETDLEQINVFLQP